MKTALCEIRPNNWYLNRAKLERRASGSRVPPVLVTEIDGTLALVDGHTRAYRAWQRGETEIEAEMKSLDEIGGPTDLYRWIHRMGPRILVHMIADLDTRIVDDATYEKRWIGLCREFDPKTFEAELPLPLFEALVALERENMTPILAASGLAFEESRMREDLVRTKRLAYVGDEHRIDACLRYSNPDATGVITINSLQLRGGRDGAHHLRALLGNARHDLEAMSFSRVLSVAQSANVASHRLHRKLGFTIVDESPAATRYAIARETLLDRLAHFAQRDSALGSGASRPT